MVPRRMKKWDTRRVGEANGIVGVSAGLWSAAGLQGQDPEFLEELVGGDGTAEVDCWIFSVRIWEE